MGTGRAAITRENGQRYVGVRMNVRNRDLGSFVAEAQQQGRTPRSTLPPGYEMTWGGEFENQQRAMERLALVIPLALVITFLLLFSAFGTRLRRDDHPAQRAVRADRRRLRARRSRGMTLSVSAAVGFIALLGQAVLNGVLVVAAIRARLDARRAARTTPSSSGARERLRAVLDDGAARVARPPAGGDVARHRQRDAAADRRRRRRRDDLRGAAHADRAARSRYYWACRAREIWRNRQPKPATAAARSL